MNASEQADLIVKATAATLRQAAEWLEDSGQRDEVYKVAERVEALNAETDDCCPVCQETTCDDGCPLAVIRQPQCAGKSLEHHERTNVVDHTRWECPECGDSGTFADLFAKLLALMPSLDRLQAQMFADGAVFLVPSDATPGYLGECFRRPVYRLQGIPAPLIALQASAHG